MPRGFTLSSAPKTVPSVTPVWSASLAAAWANWGTPYMPLWSVMARASRPRRAASATSSAGLEAPSRKLYDEWQCSSAQGGTWPPGPAAGARAGSRVTGRGGDRSASASSAGPPVPQDSRRWSSRHGTGGLSHPMASYPSHLTSYPSHLSARNLASHQLPLGPQRPQPRTSPGIPSHLSAHNFAPHQLSPRTSAPMKVSL